MTTLPKDRRAASLRLATAAVFALCTSQAAHAAEWPTFEPGQWQFERVMDGTGPERQAITRTVCIDPTADQAQQREKLAAAGCRFTEPDVSGTTYRYTATCRIAGMTSISESVLEAASARTFTITVDSDIDGMKSHEVMTAKRVGDCEQ